MTELEGISLDDFSSISLMELEEDFLLARNERKFFFHKDELPYLLSILHEEFDILQVKGEREQKYYSAYLDTESYDCYLHHHNNWRNRYKVRFRDYTDSELTFLEIKHKQNSGFTTKNRIQVDYGQRTLDQEMEKFVSHFSPLEPAELSRSLDTQYSRSTFVHKNKQARLTLDSLVTFKRKGSSKTIDRLLILELKYGKEFDHLRLMRKLKLRKIYPNNISKYCIGICNMVGEIKKNNFKMKLLAIKRIQETN